MLITRHFVFVHLPKTGGTFLRKVCERELPGRWLVDHDISGHAGVRMIPEEFRHLPRFSLVRNPWDWYVSWFAFQQRLADEATGEGGAQSPPIWPGASNHGRNTFTETITKVCNGDFGTIDEVFHATIAEMMAESDIGLFSAYYRKILCGLLPGDEPRLPENTRIGRMENLREDFIAFLRDFDIPVTVSLIDAIRNASKMNTTRHAEYAEYYDPALRELVGWKDREVVEPYGYAFGGPVTPPVRAVDDPR